MKQQCCVCKKLRQENEWIRSKEPITEKLSHTYCPACLSQTVRAMRAEVAAANACRPLATVS